MLPYILIPIIITIIVIITLIIYHKKKSIWTSLSKDLVINLSGALIIVFSIIISSQTYTTNKTNEIKTTIEEKYHLQLENTAQNTINLTEYDNEQLTGPIKATMQSNNAKRIYDIYVKKEEDSPAIYIKNEKGAYIPITETTTQTTF